MGPLLFNIFTLKSICDVYNYADDNTLSYSHKNPVVIKGTLEKASKQAVIWFESNFMKANSSKFQAISSSREEIQLDIQIEGDLIKSASIVKLCGIHIDSKLNSNHHNIKVLATFCKFLGFPEHSVHTAHLSPLFNVWIYIPIHITLINHVFASEILFVIISAYPTA